MPIPTPISAETDSCDLARRWGIADELARRIVAMATSAVDLGLIIISGFRSCEQQEDLARAGRPAAPCDLSTHTLCPAIGADLWTTPAPVTAVRARFVAAATLAGLRVGGGGPVDPLTGIPQDWNHVDLRGVTFGGRLPS